MMQLNRILAATDLSTPARHATERAALVSKETGVPLDLLHVANLAALERLRQRMAIAPDGIQQRVLNAARERLDDLAASLRKRYGVSAGVRVVAGSMLVELTKEVDSLAVGLLVCGAKGESAIRHLFLGTTALRVLSTTSCPVLVVKQAPREPYRRLLVPVDFSPSSLRAIRHAQSIAAHAEIVLLNVFDVPFEGNLRYAGVDEDTINYYQIIAKQGATEMLHALRDEAGLSPHTCRLIVRRGDPASRIIVQEKEQGCDLIVMGKHGESALADLLLGSVTRHVLAESRSDVLISV
jgi:universal stress protein E